VQTESVNWDLVRSEFKALIAAAVESGEMEGKTADLDTILSGKNVDEDQAGLVKKATIYAERLGATLSSSPSGHAFINGKHFDMNDVGFDLLFVLKTDSIFFFNRISSDSCKARLASNYSIYRNRWAQIFMCL
jgi:hypothetical protein